MNTKSSQIHVYELRIARMAAWRLARMIARDIWGFQDVDLPYQELSVKESNRRDWTENLPRIGETACASTQFTFRFEGGIVVRIFMSGIDDWNYGFQWRPEKAEIRTYKGAYDSTHSGDEKVSLVWEDWGEKWWEKKISS
jgi:hypothetical protein